MSTGRSGRLARAILRPGREKPVLGGHPWIFSGSLERMEGYHAPGDPCEILSASGERLGFGYLNANSQIVCRVVSRDEPPGPRLWAARLDAALALRERLAPAVGLLSGALPSPLLIREGGLEFAIDPARGHKTGFYLDQRDNRRLAGQLARGVPVLNCFCYSGGFSVQAAAGGGEPVVSVDLSREAVELARANLERNGCADAAARCVRADVFHHLRADRSRYGLIVLDPPKFARREGEVADAARGYHDINRLALERLAPGGQLLTFSCSQAVNLILFQQIVFEAAKEARQELQVLGRLGAGADHPFNACHREGEYLKGLWLRRVG